MYITDSLFHQACGFWGQHREASCNWLAFGLLLAAWNAADPGAANVQRPESLRAYRYVSARAAQRSVAMNSTILSKGHKSVNEL